MLIQQYLNNKTLEELEKELAISATHHSHLPLVILNYSQIDSPKTDPIVHECRSIILEKNSWKVVSRAFFRFFNLGEFTELTEKFNWNNYRAHHKEDGSLIQLFYYEGWRMATRSTFGNLPLPESSVTWAELFWQTLGDITDKLNKDYSYVFELCSPLNQVVTIHNEPKVVLLDINNKSVNQFIKTKSPSDSMLDDHITYVDQVAKELGVPRPKEYNLKGQNVTREFVNNMTDQEEGLVCQDDSGMRLKIKNPKWLCLAALTNNGGFYYTNLYEYVLSGDTDEITTYFPHTKEKVRRLKEFIDSQKEQINLALKKWGHLDHKEFALALGTSIPLYWICFLCRRNNMTVDEVFRGPNKDWIKRNILNLLKERNEIL